MGNAYLLCLIITSKKKESSPMPSRYSYNISDFRAGNSYKFRFRTISENFRNPETLPDPGIEPIICLAVALATTK